MHDTTRTHTKALLLLFFLLKYEYLKYDIPNRRKQQTTYIIAEKKNTSRGSKTYICMYTRTNSQYWEIKKQENEQEEVVVVVVENEKERKQRMGANQNHSRYNVRFAYDCDELFGILWVYCIHKHSINFNVISDEKPLVNLFIRKFQDFNLFYRFETILIALKHTFLERKWFLFSMVYITALFYSIYIL